MTFFTSDDSFYRLFDSDPAFRVANYVARLASKTGKVYASMQTIGEKCWPNDKPGTQRMKATRAIKSLEEIGFIKRSDKRLAGGVVSYDVNLAMLDDKNLSTDNVDGVIRNLAPGDKNLSRGCTESYQGVIRNLALIRELEIDLVREEEESENLLHFEENRAKPQEPKAAAPRDSKSKLTIEQLDRLRKLCSHIHDLRADPYKRKMEDVLQIGCDKFGYEGLVELVKCIRHDPLMSVSPDHRNLMYAYNTSQRVLEAGRAAFEAERIQRQQWEEKMALERAEKAMEEEYQKSDEYKREMEETRLFIENNLKTQKWFLDSKAENNVA